LPPPPRSCWWSRRGGADDRDRGDRQQLPAANAAQSRRNGTDLRPANCAPSTPPIFFRKWGRQGAGARARSGSEPRGPPPTPWPTAAQGGKGKGELCAVRRPYSCQVGPCCTTRYSESTRFATRRSALDARRRRSTARAPRPPPTPTPALRRGQPLFCSAGIICAARAKYCPA
jgi:hypothetical protein